MNWVNLGAVISERKSIDPGGAIHGAVAFILPTNELDSVLDLSEFSIVVNDFAGRRSTQVIEMKDEWLKAAKKTVIRNIQFTHDSDTGMTYPQ